MVIVMDCNKVVSLPVFIPTLETLARRVVMEINIKKYFGRNVKMITVDSPDNINDMVSILSKKIQHLKYEKLSDTSLYVWREVNK